MQKKNKLLIIFVKAPVAGLCKTRLIPLLNPQSASDFYKSLVLNCLQQLTTITDIDICVHVYPDTQHPFIQQLTQRYAVSLQTQQGKNLGERMYCAIHTSLSNYSQVVLIGSDCPALDKQYIQQAFTALNNHQIVIGPALDGGYVLIGASQINADVFKHINWSTDQVLQQSIDKISSAGFSYTCLQTLYDIDTPADYLKYKSQLDKSQNNWPDDLKTLE